MSAPPITERHKPHFHRRAPFLESVRVATTANITISTALNNGDILDGVTLATGDRVLVKDQSTGSQNGIIVVGVTPVRDYDVSTDDPAFGFLVYVREGTTNGGKIFKNTNTSAPTIDTTALTFTEFSGGSLTDHTHAATGSGSNGGGATLSPGTLNLPTATSPAQTADGQVVWDSDDDVLTVGDGSSRKTLGYLGSTTPSGDSGAGSAGTSKETSRADHVHPAGAGSGTLTTIEEVDGSPTDSAVTKLVFPNGTLSIASHVATYTPAGGGGGPTDYVSGPSGSGQIIIPGMYGSADIQVAGTNDDEFDTTDTSDPMTGWTTLGSPTTHDMNSTRKSHYYLKCNAAALGLHGIYKTAPSMPFTVTCKFTDYVVLGANARAQLAIIEAGPGKLLTFGFAGNNSRPGELIVDLWNSRTSYASTPVALNPEYAAKYLRAVVTSSTSIQFSFSLEGGAGSAGWWNYGGANNPGFTVSAVGIVGEGHTSGQAMEALVDWIRFT